MTRKIGNAHAEPRPQPQIFMGILGASPAMRELFGKLEKIAKADTGVHISGESGTGKELVAVAIHDLSKRAGGPLIRVNCGAITESLLESELFGHEAGAFTGAIKRKLGRFELAHGGTIFLDEIGDISAAMQVKLLRVLQEKELERVGGEVTVKVDVRVVSATNRDLKADVHAGRFREDLYYRLHIVPIHILPLRERPDDIMPLAYHFLEKTEIVGFEQAAEDLLRDYHFPGNVRELQNIIERAVVFATPPMIRVDDLDGLPKQLPQTKPTRVALAISAGRNATDLSLEDVDNALRATGAVARAAVLLGCDRGRIYRILKREAARQLKIDETMLSADEFKRFIDQYRKPGPALKDTPV